MFLYLHNTSWWQPMGKDTPALKRLFYAMWMLSCDLRHMHHKRVHVNHKGISFYVVCFFLSHNMIVFPTPVML